MSGNPPTPRDIDLAYLAGVIDADGYVTASKVLRGGRWYFGAQIGITGSSREPHDLAASTFGGRVNGHQPNRLRAHHKLQYHWQRTGTKAMPVIHAVLPHLRIKSARAQLVIELQDRVDWIRLTRGDDDPFPWMHAGYDPVAGLSALVDDIRACHGRTRSEYPERVA